MYTNKYDSPIGELYISVNESALTAISLFALPITGGEAPTIYKEVERELDEYFSGTRKTFEVKTEFEGTPFKRDCMQALFEVPYGKTISYSELARRAGHPKAVRAAATVCAKNPIAIIYPCHRITRKDSVGAYGGGVEKKQWLLDHESHYA